MMTDGFSAIISENTKDIQALEEGKITYVTLRTHPDWEAGLVWLPEGEDVGQAVFFMPR